ncbi:MAG TPA: hypothetical protein VFZ80_03065, partial [Acidimicrobiia bacterium]
MGDVDWKAIDAWRRDAVLAQPVESGSGAVEFLDLAYHSVGEPHSELRSLARVQRVDTDVAVHVGDVFPPVVHRLEITIGKCIGILVPLPLVEPNTETTVGCDLVFTQGASRAASTSLSTVRVSCALK